MCDLFTDKVLFEDIFLKLTINIKLGAD